MRLLECYVLWAIGELSSKDTAHLEQITPELRKALNHSGSWQQIIEAAMDLPPEAVEEIRENWAMNLRKRSAAGIESDPEAYAREFVDENLMK